jgi:hypothetical protein
MNEVLPRNISRRGKDEAHLPVVSSQSEAFDETPALKRTVGVSLKARRRLPL